MSKNLREDLFIVHFWSIGKQKKTNNLYSIPFLEFKIQYGYHFFLSYIVHWLLPHNNNFLLFLYIVLAVFTKIKMKLKSYFFCIWNGYICFCTSILYFLWFLNAKHSAIITLNFPTNGYQKQYLLIKNQCFLSYQTYQK